MHLMQIADDKVAKTSDFVGWFEEVRDHDPARDLHAIGGLAIGATPWTA
jgi:hypothetical protein